MDVVGTEVVIFAGEEYGTSVGTEDVVGYYFGIGVGDVAYVVEDGVAFLAGGYVEDVRLERCKIFCR